MRLAGYADWPTAMQRARLFAGMTNARTRVTGVREPDGWHWRMDILWDQTAEALAARR